MHDEQVTLWAVEGQTLQELWEVVQNLPHGYLVEGRGSGTLSTDLSIIS